MDEDSLMMLLMPDMMASAQERYDILREIHKSQPVGRPLLTVGTKLSDDVVRQHLLFLDRSGLIVQTSRGIRLTQKGESILAPLSPYFQKSPALAEEERQLARILSMKRVILVRGDADTSSQVVGDMALETGLTLLRTIRDGNVIAISGGRVMWNMAQALPSLHMNVDVLPARGGFGQNVKYLPNVAAAMLASRLGGKNYVLHIPDGLPSDLYVKVKNAMPGMRDMEKLYAKTDILLTGVNRLDHPYWDELPGDVKDRLTTAGACGEALGSFADMQGKTLYRLYNVGVSVDDLSSIPHVIIAAGGSRKGASILAMARAGVRGTLITDEGAAHSIFSLIPHSISNESFRRVQTS